MSLSQGNLISREEWMSIGFQMKWSILGLGKPIGLTSTLFKTLSLI